MRRRTSHHDSLDLFLDTICNMFGGIIFVVMLLVLLSFGRSSAVVKDAGLSTEQQNALMQRHRERDELEARKAMLEAAIAAVVHDLDQVRASVPSDLWNEMQTLLTQIGTAEEQLDEYDRYWAELKERHAETEVRLATREKRRTDLSAEVKRVRRELDLVVQSQTVEARLPVTRRTTKRPVWVMLRNDRAFLLYEVSRGISSGMPEDRDVEMQRFQGGNLFTAKKGGGFSVSSRIDEEERWLELLQAIDPLRQQVVFAVYPDSYESFLLIKTATLRAGIQYDVVPMDEADPMALGPGMHDTTQ